ncbi:OpgC domain-containing protein [Rhodobacteraceae bacterium]|nr:OpgC domain-containing protein [Paracoccaceae bacterium]
MAFADPDTTMSQSVAPPIAMPTVRDPRLDFFRGIAMFIILIAHTPGNWMTLWIPARFGFSDATEIFVFCSGMASAIAFGKSFEARGFAIGTARVGFRVWQVYWAHIGLFFAVATTVVVLNAMFPDGDRNYVGQLNLWPFFKDTETNLVGLLTLTYVPNYFDILPMYMVVLAMMPLVILLKWVDLRLAIGFVFVVWFMAQGRILDLVGLEYLSFNLPAEPWSEREWFFNPFGWQLIFFTGFAFMSRWIPAPPVKVWLFALAVLIVLANIPLSNVGIREFGFGAVDEGQNWARQWRIDNRIWITKSDFGILRYVHFLALAYVAYVLVGPKGSRIMPSMATHIFAKGWRLILGIIMKVGQQSLAVFIGSMYVARLLGATFDQIGRSYTTMIWVNMTGFAILIAIAYGAGWFKSQPWKKKV